MKKPKLSKEEKFLHKLHELAIASGDPQNEIDRYVIGKALGIHDRSLDNIVQVLTKNGLTKKTDEAMVQLTKNGLAFLELS